MLTFLSKILGPLPASTSLGGKLNSIDYQKILRMAIVCFLGAWAAKFSANGNLSFSAAVLDAGQAGLYALSAALVEAIRRWVVSNLPETPVG